MKKHKEDVFEDLILDDDDDDELLPELEEAPKPAKKPRKGKINVDDKVLCQGNYLPGGKIRQLFIGKVVREVNFSDEFSHCGSSGKGYEIECLEGNAPNPSGTNSFLGRRDVFPLNAGNTKKWNSYKKSRSKPGRSRKKKRKR